MSKPIDNDNDEGANLMAASPTRDTRPGGVNPGMYYRPLTPPAGSYSLDGDDGDRRWKFGFDLITALRLVPLGLSLADIICWSQGGIPHLDPSNKAVLAILILTFIWNILHFFLRAVCFCTSVSSSCPILLCQIGDWRYVFNDPESGRRFVEPRKGADTLRGKRIKLFLTAVVDIVFGIVLLSLGGTSDPVRLLPSGWQADLATKQPTPTITCGFM